MTRITLPEAEDLMFGHAVAVVNAAGISTPRIAFPDKPFTIPTSDSWARITVKPAGRRQRGFSDSKRKWRTFGTLCVELFTLQGDGNTAARAAAETVLVGLESTTSSPIAYRNIRPEYIGPDSGFTKTNIYADFEYDDHH